MFTIQDLALDEVIPANILLYANIYASKATVFKCVDVVRSGMDNDKIIII
jgi:hypothetical protein